MAAVPGPLTSGGVLVAVISMTVLAVQNHRGQRVFEMVIVSMPGIITAGFLAGLVVAPPGAGGLGGLVPRLEGSRSLVLAASMLGATVMPHAIHLHSALSRDRHGGAHSVAHTRYLLHATRADVVIALIGAGSVDVGMLLLAARNLYGVDGTDTIEGAHAAIAGTLGPAVGVVFAVGLSASGLTSTAVGSYAGDVVTAGLLRRHVPLFARRACTMIPADILLAVGVEPTAALVGSPGGSEFRDRARIGPARLVHRTTSPARAIHERPVALGLRVGQRRDRGGAQRRLTGTHGNRAGLRASKTT